MEACALKLLTFGVKNHRLNCNVFFSFFIQSVRCDVEWEIETAPIRMTQNKWLLMMKHRFPSGGFLDDCTESDVGYGLRELVEGIFKYQGPEVEFYDRLLIVVATHQLPNTKLPIIQRTRDKNQIADLFNLPYKLVVDDKVDQILKEKEAEEKRKREIYK